MQELTYSYDEETVEALHDRALTIFDRLKERYEMSPLVEQSVYNSVLNMVAQVRVGNIVVPGPNNDLTKRKQS